MGVYVGIDLAWKPGRESGICVLEGEAADVVVRRLDATVLETEDLADELEGFGEQVVVAVDAPLILPVEGRTADREVAKAYGRFHASPYTPSLRFLQRSGMAGPDLAKALGLRGFSFDPGMAGRQKVAIEVFPHTCHVELFELHRRLSYKKGRLAARQEGMRDYALRTFAFLAPRLPALAAAVVPLAEELAGALGGRRLKHLEDQLDAATCAYTAWHAAAYGPASMRVFGAWQSGAIVVPVLAGTTSVLAPTFPSVLVNEREQSSRPGRGAGVLVNAPHLP